MPSLRLPDRREVLRLIAAGTTAALASCSKPDQPIYPAAMPDPGAEPGGTRRYATALALAGYARGVTGLVVDGRPIKLEGLARHPASLGATDMFAEAAILDLYDPQRLRAPTGPGGVASWTMVEREALARLAGSDGSGLRLLTGRVTSPTLLARIEGMKRRFPAMRHVRAEPIDDDAEREGARLAFGRLLQMRPRLDRADVVVALDADPLGPGPEQIAFARAWGRRRLAPDGPQRLHVFEPGLSQTGACADHRTAATPGQIADALLAIAAALGGGVPPVALPESLARPLRQAIDDLKRAQGRALVLVGRGQPAPIHALGHWVNQRLAAPIDWIEPVDPEPLDHRASLAALAGEMHAGKVSALVMLESDPLYHAPAALGFAQAFGRVPFTVAASRFPTATAHAARWALPLADPLESWGDLRAADGTASIVQPLVRPFYDTRSPLGMIDLIDPPALPQDDHDRVQAQWNLDPASWQRTLTAGMVAGSAAQPVAAPAARLTPYPPSSAAAGLTLVLAPSPTLWDGRMASNAWAQECPDPITKEVWGSALRIGAATAAGLGLDDGARVSIDGAGETAIRIMPEQAEGTATLLYGYGRHQSGPIAAVGGINGFAIRDGAGDRVAGVRLTRTDGGRAITDTQHLFALEGDLEKLFPVVEPGGATTPPEPHPTMLPRRPAPEGEPPQWGMVIDTAVCIGCNACVVACQAENNVPAIGPEEMARNRDMHWLRVDRYAHDGGEGFQPVPCMQCETAPCEPVCPVEASIHDEQGLNVQVYNRCIGTRFCQSNCPYKVRRFNFLDYADANLWGEADAASITAQRNPEVTVRARGVMEKCNYCLQRIGTALHDAAAANRPLDADAVTTACQAACPTQAIHFGDLTRPDARVTELRDDPRHYALLEDLGTRPRTTYLARLANRGTPA